MSTETKRPTSRGRRAGLAQQKADAVASAIRNAIVKYADTIRGGRRGGRDGVISGLRRSGRVVPSSQKILQYIKNPAFGEVFNRLVRGYREAGQQVPRSATELRDSFQSWLLNEMTNRGGANVIPGVFVGAIASTPTIEVVGEEKKEREVKEQQEEEEGYGEPPPIPQEGVRLIPEVGAGIVRGRGGTRVPVSRPRLVRQTAIASTRRREEKAPPAVDNAQEIVEEATGEGAGSFDISLSGDQMRYLDESLRGTMAPAALNILREQYKRKRFSLPQAIIGVGAMIGGRFLETLSGVPGLGMVAFPAIKQGFTELVGRTGGAISNQFRITPEGRVQAVSPVDRTPSSALVSIRGANTNLLYNAQRAGTIPDDFFRRYLDIYAHEFGNLRPTRQQHELETKVSLEMLQYLESKRFQTDDDEQRANSLDGFLNRVQESRQSVGATEIGDLMRTAGLSPLEVESAMMDIYRDVKDNPNIVADQRRLVETLTGTINELPTTEENKQRIRIGMVRIINRAIAHNEAKIEEKEEEYTPHADVEEEKIVMRDEPSRVSRYLTGIANSDIVRAAVDRINPLYITAGALTGTVGGAYRARNRRYRYGLMDVLYNLIGGGALGAIGGGLAGLTIQAANTALGGLFGIEIPAVVGDYIPSFVAAGVPGVSASGILEKSIIPPTLEKQEQEDQKAGKNRGVGTLRPKFIVPSVDILEPTKQEQEADFDEFAAFDYVQVSSEGGYGTIKDNVLKAQHFREEQLRYGGAGVNMPNVYGKYPPFDTKEEEKLLMPLSVIPEMSFPKQEYDLGRYDVNDKRGYDWNGDTLAVEMLNPYRFGTRVEQNAYTMPTSILYSVVP